MSEKQRLKHIADRQPQPLTEGSELDAAGPTPDGLGAWNGGKAHRSIDGAKAKPQRTGDTKNKPGIDYATKITHRQDADFNEIHTDANGDFFLYNHKTDAWDILGDSADIPYYRDLNGDLWAYDVKVGAWTVPVVIEYDEGDTVASAIA
jgi:hypothetical protein